MVQTVRLKQVSYIRGVLAENLKIRGFSGHPDERVTEGLRQLDDVETILNRVLVGAAHAAREAVADGFRTTPQPTQLQLEGMVEQAILNLFQE